MNRGIYYNKTNSCDKIKKVGFSWRRCGNKLIKGKVHYEYDESGNWTGKWLCIHCFDIIYNIENGYVKTSRINGNIKPNSNIQKGDNFEKLTHIWKGVEILGIKNRCSPIDHSRHPILGIIQTKGATYNSIEKCWFQGFKNEHDKDFDILILYCANKNNKRIERIYIIPWEEILRRTAVRVSKNPTDRWGNYKVTWYEKYRVTDEEEIEKVNNIFESILLEVR